MVRYSYKVGPARHTEIGPAGETYISVTYTVLSVSPFNINFKKSLYTTYRETANHDIRRVW